MKKPAIILAVLFLIAPPLAAQDSALTRVDVELCLAVDGSGSIDPDEFQLQRAAYAGAITDPRVMEIIQSGFDGGIAVAMMEWGGADSMHPVAGWAYISTPQEAEAFAAELLAAPRMAIGWNSISNAIAFCHGWIEDNQFEGFRKVIDVSGDSGQRGGLPLEAVRQSAIERGITINALALNYRSGGMTGPGGMPLTEHYRRDVIGGTGAFTIAVDAPNTFTEALVRKLILEIAMLAD